MLKKYFNQDGVIVLNRNQQAIINGGERFCVKEISTYNGVHGMYIVCHNDDGTTQVYNLLGKLVETC